jgi:secondary thiamine-phosphate synthase enzyme
MVGTAPEEAGRGGGCGIRAVRLAIAHVEEKFKYDDHKSPERRSRVAHELAARTRVCVVSVGGDTSSASGLGQTQSVHTEVLEIATGRRDVVVDLTRQCSDWVHGLGDGLLHVFVPHATAGIAILETGAGSDEDLLAALRDLLPADDRWAHRHGSSGHGRSHVMPALIPPYATVPVLGGRLALGTWQSICLVDLNVDNANRQVRLSFVTG